MRWGSISTNRLVKDNPHSEDFTSDEKSENGKQTNCLQSNEVTTDNIEQLTKMTGGKEKDNYVPDNSIQIETEQPEQPEDRFLKQLDPLKQ